MGRAAEKNSDNYGEYKDTMMVHGHGRVNKMALYTI